MTCNAFDFCETVLSLAPAHYPFPAQVLFADRRVCQDLKALTRREWERCLEAVDTSFLILHRCFEFYVFNQKGFVPDGTLRQDLIQGLMPLESCRTTCVYDFEMALPLINTSSQGNLQAHYQTWQNYLEFIRPELWARVMRAYSLEKYFIPSLITNDSRP